MKEEKEKLEKAVAEIQKRSSNLTEDLDEEVQFALKPSSLWASGDYHTKQRIQKAVFPRCLKYDKKKDAFLTPFGNGFIRRVCEKSAKMVGKVEGQRGVKSPLAHWVPRPGIEPGSRASEALVLSIVLSRQKDAKVASFLQKCMVEPPGVSVSV